MKKNVAAALAGALSLSLAAGVVAADKADDEQRRQNQFRPHRQIPVDRIRQQIERKGKLTVYFCKPVFPVPFFQAGFKKFIRGKKPECQQTESGLPRGVG